MEGTVHNPAAMDDWSAMLADQYEIPFASEVELTKNKPLIFVYWGKHITSKEEARATLPDTWLGDYLSSFYPEGKPAGGGWIGMARFEGSPIQFEYIYKAKPKVRSPPPTSAPDTNPARTTTRG